MSTEFVVTAERSHGWWVLESENGAVSQVRHLASADEEMREAIAYLAGLPEDQVQIRVVPVMPDQYSDLIQASSRLREQSEQANRDSALRLREAVQVLADLGLSTREMAFVLGVSTTRAQQLRRSDLVAS